MALRRASHPALVAPLVDSLRHDSDRQVRLAALASLTTNFSADPLVRSALEAIEREDADPILRATVRRALYGPAQWRDDVVAALADTAPPYEARLAPLIANTTAGSSQQEFEMSRVRQAALREQQILGPLVTLIREHVRESSHAQETANALDLVSSVDDPAVFGLFLQLAQEGALPVPVTGPVGSWVTNHQDDPRVREILPQVVPMVPSELLERMREISGKPGEGSTTFGSGAIITVVPTPQ
jgi:hypothetical protein